MSGTLLAYPEAFPQSYSRFRSRLRRILEGAGYQSGVSTIIGTAGRSGDRLLMPRLPVNSGYDLALFRAKLAGAYDWLHALQYAWSLRA